MARICLVTTGQPSTNPRLVKEADALVSAGHAVHVIGAHRADWADGSDRALLADRAWTNQIIDFRRANTALFWKLRIRHRVARFAGRMPAFGGPWLGAAVSPVTPELTMAALGHRADLYIAHNLGALPAAAAAASRHGARLGFDAEDFHSGQFTPAESTERQIARIVEERFLPRCDYVTAASPGVADEYSALGLGDAPTVILNVFPRAERPSHGPEEGHVGGRWRLYWFSQTIGRDRGLEEAIAAVAQLADLPVEIHVRGEWQPDYETRLRTQARRVGLADARIVAHAPAPAAQMVRLAAAYDVGLALEPGRSDNNDLALSNKVFTYVLAGVPVLASATTAHRAIGETLGDAIAVVDIGDVAGVADALRFWFSHPARLQAARRAAWALGADRFNWDVEKQKFLGVVDRVLSQPRVRAPRAAELAS